MVATALRPEIRVDWFRVLDDLKRAGFSFAALELHVQIAQSTLKGYKAGSEPKHADGERLLAFWCGITGNSRESVHLVNRYSHTA